MSPKYVGFGEAISLFFSNYVNFKGRSTRSEYWYATLFTCLVSFVLGLISGFIGNEILVYIFSAAIFIPGWSSTFRRLHDAGRSALWLFLSISYSFHFPKSYTPFCKNRASPILAAR